MIKKLEKSNGPVLGFEVTGKLHDEDYKQFVPAMETILTAEGRVRLFVQFQDFHGWDVHAAWDDFKFGLKHYADFERIAMVGDRKWERWMAGFCKPFTKAEVKYFDSSQVDAAWKWLQEQEEGHKAKKEDEPTSDRPAEPYRSSDYVWFQF